MLYNTWILKGHSTKEVVTKNVWKICFTDLAKTLNAVSSWMQARVNLGISWCTDFNSTFGPTCIRCQTTHLQIFVGVSDDELWFDALKMGSLFFFVFICVCGGHPQSSFVGDLIRNVLGAAVHLLAVSAPQVGDMLQISGAKSQETLSCLVAYPPRPFDLGLRDMNIPNQHVRIFRLLLLGSFCVPRKGRSRWGYYVVPGHGYH
jgi:hypothetical protein